MRKARSVFFIIATLFILSTLVRNIFDYRSKLQFYDSYKKDYEAQKKENLSLKTQILKKSDQDELEKTIRNKLNLLRENEVDVILPKPTPTTVIITPTPLPNWEQWKNVLMGKNN